MLCDGLKAWGFVEIFARDGVAHIVKMNTESLAGKFNYLLKDKQFPSTEELKVATKQRAANKFLPDDRN